MFYLSLYWHFGYQLLQFSKLIFKIKIHLKYLKFTYHERAHIHHITSQQPTLLSSSCSCSCSCSHSLAVTTLLVMAMDVAVAPSGADAGPQLRSFQRKILELAREQNVVMVGSTGIGKTFVAIALLAEQDYASGKRAVFMAPTRQLVLQITAKVRLLSTLPCRAYYGREVELWDEQTWASELRATRVLVCTPDVVRNVVEKGYVPITRINLLVFDECHHVTKRHPYAQLMKMYERANASAMPRIFGATACPTKGCAEALHATLERVELSEAQMTQFAAAAPVVYEVYAKAPVRDDGPAPHSAMDVEAMLQQGMTADDARVCAALWVELSDVKALQVVAKLLKKGRSNADASAREKLVRKFVRSCFVIFTTLGAWCYYRFVELEIERLAMAASLLLAVPGSMFGLDKDAVATLLLLQAKRSACAFAATPKVAKIEALVRMQLFGVADNDNEAMADAASDDEDEDVRDGGASARAAAFLMAAIVGDDDDSSDGEDDTDASASGSPQASASKPRLQGIVFVHTRMECRVLTEYLNDKFAADTASDSEDNDAEDMGDEQQHPLASATPRAPSLCACMLGQSMVSDTASFNLPTFQKTLKDFETGATRILVSTSVSAEGVDFPLCSFIVVADRVMTPRMFIQLRGRARHEDGVVYYLGEDGNADQALQFKQLAAQAQAIHGLDFSHDKDASLLSLPRSIAADRLIGHPFTPDETTLVIDATGAKLDLDSSVQTINQFCQSLPPALFTVDCKRMYAYNGSTHGKTPIFQCTLTLPPELELAPFTSAFMLSKAMAKASAAFVAGRTLWERGLLDDSLNSVYRKAKSKAAQSSRQLDFFLGRLNQ